MRKKLLLGGGSFFLLFVFFSFLVHKNLFNHLDFDTTVRLQDHISRKFDSIFSAISLVGQVDFIGVFLLVFLFFVKKIRAFFAVGFLFGAFHLLELYGKVFVNHKPPPHFMLRTQIPSNFPQFYVSTQNSYPSGHAARSLFFTLLIGFFVYRSKKLSTNTKLVIYAVLVGFDIVMLVSRVYLGEHWLSDVIGGSLLGAAFGFLGVIFL